MNRFFNSVFEKFKELLGFLRIINGDGAISLTNIAVGVIIVKLALAPALDFGACATLLTVLMGYNFKRWHVSKKDAAPNELATIKSDINKLKMRAGFGETLR